MRADAATEHAVMTALQRMTDAYRERDLAAAMACFWPDADAMIYGTGADEKRVGPSQIQAQIERDWAQSDAAEIVLGTSAVSSAGPVAWASVDGSFTVTAGGESMTIPARVTAVLERRDDAWRIHQAHFSMPAMSQEEGQSF